MQTLDDALRSLAPPRSLPHALPACHLTDARHLASITASRSLSPWFCKVFREELVYVFYGGIFYRKSAIPTSNASLLPVGLVFEPVVLKLIERYYPFDTGAAQAGKYGPRWRPKLRNFKNRFRVNGHDDYNTPARMVHFLFGSNEAYLSKPPSTDFSNGPEPLPTLHSFLSDEEHLASMEVDQRYRRFEGHAKVPVPLDSNLLWVGYPEGFEPDFFRLCECLKPVVPMSYSYRAHPARRPSEVAAVLEEKAHEAVIQRYLNHPGEAA